MGKSFAPIRVVLVGAGRMGRNHLRVLASDSRFKVVAVLDTRIDEALLSQYSVPASYEDVASLATFEWDACVIAAPTETHFDLGQTVFRYGKPVLMEKPLASTPAQARDLAALADRFGTPVIVGHLERFNPAVLKLKELLSLGVIGKPIHFSITRVGGYPTQVKQGNNVLLDLAVHDLDVLNFLVGEQRLLSAIAHSTWREGVLDTAEIMTTTCDRTMSASIHVNWVTPTKIRSIRVTGTKGVLFVDYILQSVTMLGGALLSRSPQDDFDFDALVEQYKASDRVEFGILKEEPLKAQLVQFYRLIRREGTTACGIQDAIKAIELADEAIRHGGGASAAPMNA